MDDRPIFDQRVRPAVDMRERQAGIDSKAVIHRGEQVTGRDGAIDGCTRMSIAGADNLPPTNATAGQDHAPNPRPVVAAARCIDPGRSAKFARGDHERGFQSTTPIQVIDQGRETHDRTLEESAGRNRPAC